MTFIEIKKATQSNYTSTIRIDKDANVVEKIIDYKEYSQELFNREIYWLEKLQKTNIVPKIIKYNPLTLTITMEWCGERLYEDNKPLDVYEQLFNIHMILLENHCYYNDWKYGNFLVKDNKITIIDFGWCPMVIEDYTCGGNINSKLVIKPWGNCFLNLFKR